MTRKERSFFLFFLSLFVIPELLWSPVVNFYNSFYLSTKTSSAFPWRDNFLQDSDNLYLLKLVLFIQTIGIVLGLIYLIKKYSYNKVLKSLFVILLTFLAISTALSFYFALTFRFDIL